MALQLIVGKSGSGKSHMVYQKMIQDSIHNPEKQYYMIVPEQFTMQVQKKVISMHPNHGTMNIDILSFQRLAHRVFDEVNEKQKKVLEDVGKSMVLRKVAEEKKDQLTIFKSSLNKTGFIEELKSLLSEFFQYRIGKQTLQELVKELDQGTLLHGKLSDMEKIYEGFENYVKQDFAVAEQLLEVLAQRVPDSNRLKNSVICLDGFTGFTPVQYVLIGQLIQHVEWMLVTVTMDIEEMDGLWAHLQDKSAVPYELKDYELFALSKKTILHLGEIAKEAEIEIAKPFLIKGVPYRFREQEVLAALEKNLFRYPLRQYKGVNGGLHLMICQNPREEVAFVVRKIREMIMEGTYRYRDIGIVSGAPEIYNPELKEAMERLEVPYFMDQNRSILNNPCMESIRSVLNLINSDFTYESVFRYLKAGMSKITAEETEQLENYFIACGIHGYSWISKPFRRKPRGMDEQQVEVLEGIRKALLEEVEVFRSEMKKKGATVRNMVIALCQFMEKMEYQEKLMEYEKAYEQAKDLALAKTYHQIYGNICEILDKMAVILGDETMKLDEFLAILDAGLEETKVGVIPPGLDQVMVGDLERTRFPELKVLFVVGMNDGVIPKAENGGGILNDKEREILLEKKLELAPTAKQNSMMASFYVYLNFTKPGEELYLSYPRVDGNGKSLHPSYLVGRLKQMFPDLVEKELENTIEDTIYTKADSIEFLIHGLHRFLEGEETPLFRELFALFTETDQGITLLRHLEAAAFYQNTESPLTQAISKALYGEHPSGSVTRLETYAACAFAHFLQFGLHLREREEYTIRSMDLGNVLHKTLELFSKTLDQSEDSFRTIEDEKRDQLVEQCVLEAVQDYQGDVFYSSKRNQYMITRLIRISRRTVWALQEHIRRGNFEPEDFELSFQNYKNLDSAEISLAAGTKMELQGKIDRIDTYEDEEALYVKIIDYKSGNTEFDVLDLYYGLQIQLVVYMNAALEVMKNRKDKPVIPAGIFYYNIKDPFVEDLEEEEEEDVNTALLKKLKMSGLANGEPEILEQLEEETEEGYLTVPVTRLKNGAYSKNSKVATTEQLFSIGRYVTEKMQKMGNDMLCGEIEIAPYKLGDKTACDYCEFQGVCSFDPRLGDEYRRLSTMSKEELLSQMDGKAKEEK